MASVMPASCRTFVLTHKAWPSTRLSATGNPPETASSSAAVGNTGGVQSTWFQPQPVTQSPGSAFFTAAATASRVSCLGFQKMSACCIPSPML